MQARVIQAHSSGQSLVLNKTKVFDFATNQMATANTDTLLGLMGSDQVGNPADPDHMMCLGVRQGRSERNTGKPKPVKCGRKKMELPLCVSGPEGMN
jgi:hypothetical protein